MIDDNFFLSIQDKAILANIFFGKSHYEGGRKYCRRCEVFYRGGLFCPCCGMALRVSPTARKDKEKIK
jgi:hypothetical protein